MNRSNWFRKLSRAAAMCCTVATALIGGGCAAANPPEITPAATIAPWEGPQLNLLVFGDWGTGQGAQRRVAKAMERYVTETEGEPFDAVLTTGDNFYVDLRGVDDPKWEQLFESMYDPRVIDAPFYPVFGNHDYEGRKREVELEYSRARPASRWRFVAPWYRLELPEEAPLATILMVDTNYKKLATAEWEEQMRWIRAELSRPRATPWLFVVGHEPLFSAGVHGNSERLQDDFGPLLREHGVDFYIAGHDHSLQHLSVPGWPTTFIVSGGGGAGVWFKRRDELGPWHTLAHGFVHVRLTEDRADVVYLNDRGRPIHAFSARPLRGAAAPVASPIGEP